MMGYEAPRPSSEDYDDREPLPAGSEIISTSGLHYKIKDEPVGFGGSALIYRVSRAGSLRNFIIKECYPLSKDFKFSRDAQKGIVRPNSSEIEAKQYFDIVKDNMNRENTIGQLIANQTGRTVSTWENLEVEKIIIDGRDFDAKGSHFIVLEEATGSEKRGWFLEDLLCECAKPARDDAPLRTAGLPAPQVAASIMEELLKALRDIHRAGYIHGDINDSNFFLMGCDPQNGDIGVGQLLDFGNAFKLEADGKTSPIENVFSTSGYWSPEILKSKGALRLTAATDVYSAGCLMLYLLKGMRYKKVYGKNLAKNFSVSSFVSVKKIMQCGYRREAAILFNKILTKALAYNPGERYRDAGEMLKEIIFLKKVIAPPKFNLSVNLSRSPYFVKGSRDKELARLQSDLENGTHPLWIWGIGGIGKTELAMEFARKQIERGRSACLVTFHKSIKETVMGMNFSGWRFEFEGHGEASDLEYRARLDLLRENYKDALLIVDNFDSEKETIGELQQESAYKELINLDMKILFTTRSRPNDIAPELEPLNEEDSLLLFKSIAKISAQDEGIVRKMIREVDCHPMTVELLAHTLNESWGTLTARDLLVSLQSENLNSSNLPEVKHRKAVNEREAKIYGHLRTLFKLFNSDDSYREILCHTTLLPADGFEASEFILSEDFAKKKQIKQLEGRGWIRRRAEDNSLWIHPLIRSVFKNELKPTNADCEQFLSNLWQRLDDRYPQEKKLFQQAAKLFENATKILGDKTGDHYFHAGFCHLIGDNFFVALTMEEKAISLREAAQNKDALLLARNYNDAGVAACYVQDYAKGMRFFDKAIQILELTAPDDPNTANILTNIANACLFLGDYDKATVLGERAVKIFEKTPPKNRHEQAQTYSTFGNILIWTKRLEEAKENFLTAVEILRTITPEGSIELARAYLDLGHLYALTEEPAPGITYLLEALNMQEKLLPKNHRDKMIVCELLNELYVKDGKPEVGKKFLDRARKAMKENLEYELKETLTIALDAIELRGDKMSPEEFIVHYRGAANSYRLLDELEQAEKFLSAALDKIDATVSPTEEALTYAEASKFCEAQKNFEKAVVYSKKALSIEQRETSNDFGKLSTDFMNLAELCCKAQKFEEALTYFDNAIQFQLKCSYPDFDFVKRVKKSVGMALLDLKRYDEAREVFEKVLAEWSVFLPAVHPTIKELKDLIATLPKSES